MKRLLTICATLAMLIVTNGTRGDLVFVGDPVPEGSWSSAGYTAGIGSFDLEAAKMVSPGDAFESPWANGFRNASDVPIAGWGVVLHDPTLMSWAGPSVTYLEKDMHFAGALTDPLTFDFVVFSGDTLIYDARASWSGSSWAVEKNKHYWTPTRAEVVPIPGAVLLGMLGLGAAGIKLRKYA